MLRKEVSTVSGVVDVTFDFVVRWVCRYVVGMMLGSIVRLFLEGRVCQGVRSM